MPKPSKVVIVQKPEEHVVTEVLAASIVNIARGVKQLLSGGLNEKAVVVLIQNSKHAGALTQTQIRAVLSSIEDLESEYTRVGR